MCGTMALMSLLTRGVSMASLSSVLSSGLGLFLLVTELVSDDFLGFSDSDSISVC